MGKLGEIYIFYISLINRKGKFVAQTTDDRS